MALAMEEEGEEWGARERTDSASWRVMRSVCVACAGVGDDGERREGGRRGASEAHEEEGSQKGVSFPCSSESKVVPSIR